MSQIQQPGNPASVSEVSDNAIASCVQHNVVDESITAGMVLRREIPELPVSQTQSAVPTDESSSLIKALFTSVLEDVMTELWILEKCNNQLALLTTESDIDYLKAVKYGVNDPNEVKDELDGINSKNLNGPIYKIKKLDADRNYVNKVMLETYKGLAESFTHEPLVRYINSIEELYLYRINLMEEENKNKIIRRELSRQLRQQRNHIKTVLYDTDIIIGNLGTEVENSVLQSEISSRYIDNWQKARTEQHVKTIFDIENIPSTTIEYYKQRTDHELRVHNEVETLVNISINETLAKIEEWMDKFDKDMEVMDLKIQVKKNEYQDKLDTNTQHEETLEKHDLKINNWKQFKDAREKARIYHDKMQNSAIIVQAWWRGLLVRLCLGPYRQKNKRKQKK